MSVARSISRTSGVLTFLVLLCCVAAAATAFVFWASESLDRFVGVVTSHYDQFAPTITFRNGRASITQEQPYYIGGGPMDGLVLVIDTRPGERDHVRKHLDRASNGAVLAEDRLIVKNANQIRIISLKKVPDMVLNAAFIEGMVKRYRPVVIKALVASALVYFFVVKLFQALVFALIPLIIAGIRKAAVTYGEAFKVAVFALIPPVALDVALDFTDIDLQAEWVLYVIVYVVVLVLAARDLIKSPATGMGRPDAPIAP